MHRFFCFFIFCALYFSAPLRGFAQTESSLVYLPPHAFLSKREAASWESIAVDFSEISNRLQNKGGGVTASLHFFANIQMLSTILYLAPINPRAFVFYTKENNEFVSKNFITENKGDETFAPFYLLPIHSSSEKPSLATIEKQKLWKNTFETYFNNNPEQANKKLNQLATWIQENIYPYLGKEQSKIFISALNAWHQTIDPFSRYFATSYLQSSLPPLSISTQITRLQGKIVSTPPAPVIASIHVSDFSRISVGAIMEELQRLLITEKVEALIIDLRGNSGGTLVNLKAFSSIFFPGNTEYPLFITTPLVNFTPDITRTDLSTWVTNIPLFLLIDASTKSTAEVFAGILQYYRRAILVGTTTFGKAVYTTKIPTFEGKAVLQITMNALYMPNGFSSHADGVQADIPLPIDLLATKKATQLYPNISPQPKIDWVSHAALPNDWQMPAIESTDIECFDQKVRQFHKEQKKIPRHERLIKNENYPMLLTSWIATCILQAKRKMSTIER